MKCNNIKCPYYLKPEKRSWLEKEVGVTAKDGECKYGYCKLRNKTRK